METLFQVQPLPHNHQTNADTSMTASQPAPENADGSSHPIAAGTKPHLLYKCLLDQHAQKLRKPLPIYQTQNEGSDHIPRFRSTVWLDGVSYTSPSTFQQRKMAEMDVSRIAYFDILQKAKTEALHFIQEDKTSCKSVMAEFAAKKNIGKPIYETTLLEGSASVFRSSLLFNGVTYPGANAKSKKEAEQLVARAVITKYLDSEAGNDMAVVVNNKRRQYHERNKIEEISNGSNVLGAQTGVGQDFTLTEAGTSTMAISSTPLESSLGQGTLVPATFTSSSLLQQIIPQLPVEPITPVAPVVIQPPTPQINPAVPVLTESPASQVPVEPIKPAVAKPLVLTPIPSAVVNNSCTPVVSAPLVDIPATNLSSNVTQPIEALEYIPLAGETSNKKRNRRNKKNARKKLRADAQMPVVPASEVLPFSSQ